MRPNPLAVSSSLLALLPWGAPPVHAQSFEVAVVEPTDVQSLPGHARGARESVEPVAAPPENGIVVREWLGASPIWEWTRLTGDWAGWRTDLESRGIRIDGSYTLDLIEVVRPGADSGLAKSSILDANITFDLEAMLGWSRTVAFVDFYSTDRDRDDAEVGDFQGVSSIDTGDHRDQIAELWFETWLAGDLIRLKAGKIDANEEFAFVEHGSEFMNLAATRSSVQFAMPTYPDPATGVVAFLYPTDSMSIGLGMFDGAMAVDGVRTGGRGPSTFFDDDLSDDYWLVAELGLRWTLAGSHGGRMAAGAWWHTGDFARWSGGTDDGTVGWYAIVEQRLWAEEGADPDRGIFGWLHVEGADADVAEAELSVAVGASWKGPSAARPDDSLGLFASWIDLVDEAGYEDDETAIELMYRYQLTPAIALTPSLQSILSPGGDASLDDAFVTALRLEFAF